MLFRNVELYYQLSLDDTGTKIIDLRTTDPISAIRLDFQATNGATSNKENWLNDIITKIELVDGSDQLLSLSMKQAQALQFFQTGRMPFMKGTEEADAVNREQVILQFGRWLYDPEYYLDLTKFSNPQLKITTDEDVIRAMGATGFVSNSIKCTVNLHTMQDDTPAAKGFMMQKETYTFTTGSSGDEHIDMPLDYPYVGMLIRAHKAGTDIDACINKLKLSCDAGKFAPIEKYLADIIRMNEEDNGPAQLRLSLYRKDGETLYQPIGKDPIALLQSEDSAHIFRATSAGGNSLDIAGYDHKHTHTENTDASYTQNATTAEATPTGQITTEETLHAIITGNALHSCVFLPFGLPRDPATYFDPKAWNDIDLVLTQATADARAQVVLKQLRDYGAA